jgi:hypothetical protein
MTYRIGKNTIRVERRIGPAAWASYFINGDASGLEDDEIVQADAWADDLPGFIVSCEGEAYFSSSRDAWYTTPYKAGDVIEYTIHIIAKD